jgi:hypothetical protein
MFWKFYIYGKDAQTSNSNHSKLSIGSNSSSKFYKYEQLTKFDRVASLVLFYLYTYVQYTVQHSHTQAKWPYAIG